MQCRNKTKDTGYVRGLLILFFIFMNMSNLLFAASLENQLQVQKNLNWVFSGMLTNENNIHYGYYFEIERHNEDIHTLSALINVENKSLIFVEESDAKIKDQNTLNWQVGNSYFGLNAATHRFVVGVNTDKHTGFGFRIDTLNEQMDMNKSKALRNGLMLNVSELGRLTGHVYLGSGEEEFVMAKHAWLRQIDVNKLASNQRHHDLTNVLCQFEDGSSFYVAHLPQNDALRGFMAGGKDAKGKNIRMSQFVKIKELPHEWDLSISLPEKHVHFSDLLDKHRTIEDIAAGVVIGKSSGFCTAGKRKV